MCVCNLTDVLSKFPSCFSSCSLMSLAVHASLNTSVVSAEAPVLILLPGQPGIILGFSLN